MQKKVLHSGGPASPLFTVGVLRHGHHWGGSISKLINISHWDQSRRTHQRNSGRWSTCMESPCEEQEWQPDASGVRRGNKQTNKNQRCLGNRDLDVALMWPPASSPIWGMSLSLNLFIVKMLRCKGRTFILASSFSVIQADVSQQSEASD